MCRTLYVCRYRLTIFLICGVVRVFNELLIVVRHREALPVLHMLRHQQCS